MSSPDNLSLSIEVFNGATPWVLHSEKQSLIVSLAQISSRLFASITSGPYCLSGA
jgi:hypothetical protein